MATIITTLKTHTNQDTVYPNIRAENIPDSSISATKIQDGAVSSAKIASGAIQHSNLGSNVVDNDNLADRSVSQDKLVNASVGTDQLADGAVTGAKIASGTISRDRIKLVRKTLHEMFVDAGEFILFIHGIEALIDAPYAKFSYLYKPDAYTVYTITPLYAYACTENSTTPNMGIKFVFTLPDGTNKTIQWLLSGSGTEPSELADIVCEYFGN